MRISKSTDENYEKIALRIKKKCEKFTLTKNTKWDTIAKWMVKDIWPDVRHNTWRLYRSSVNYYVMMHASDSYAKVSEILDTGKHPNYRSQPHRTSHGKQKYLYGGEFKALIDHLKENKNKWNVGALAWLRASVYTGLRPCEWDTAEYVKDNGDDIAPKLIVTNAKNTHGRAHGEFRTISLEHLTVKEIRIVEENLKAVKRMVNSYGYDAYYRRCADAIRNAGKKLWPNRKKRPTLYSARHQFAANCKRRGLKKVEVAALMGHATDETATTHYGKTSSGTIGTAPKADPDDVSKVKQIAHNPMNIEHNNPDKDSSNE